MLPSTTTSSHHQQQFPQLSLSKKPHFLSPPPPSNPPSPPPPPPPPSLPPPQPTVVVRKFPAPCWTQDETLALIHAYQDKWYSLRRRNLRTADWEAVADEVNRRCPNQSPPKSSAQCRHKMEKLRKRYRAEKQRINNLPLNNNFLSSNNNNRFFPSSSWVFFDLMDNMEVGPGSGPGLGSTTVVANNSSNNGVNHHGNVSVVNLGSLQQNGGFVKEEKHTNTNVNVKGKDELGKYFDEILMGMGKSGSGSGSGSGVTKFKVKNHNNHSNNNERYFDEDYSKYEGYDYNGNGRNVNFVSGFSNKRKFERGEEEEALPPKKMLFLNGGGGGGYKRGVGMGMGSRGKGRDEAVGEMAASIRMLGEEFVKMETIKLEMMREIERERMEAEMKRSKMILESQHIIVNAIVQGLKKQKKG